MIKIEVHSTRAVIRYQEPLTVGLRGAMVQFSFGEPWESLIKTAVFRQGEKTVTVADIGNEVTIPWEVLTAPGLPVLIGVYGTDGETVAIPTVWTATQPVRPGADPEGDPSTEPTPGLWEQIQGKMGSLEKLDTHNKSSLVAAINEANRPVCLIYVFGAADGTYAADHSAAEIQSMLEAKVPVACYWYDKSVMLHPSEYQLSGAPYVFTAVSGAVEYTVVIGDNGVSCTTENLARKSDIPTRTSQLENDSGLLTTAPVTSVNGQTGDVELKPPLYLVTIDDYDMADKSSSDILAAYESGYVVKCDYRGILLNFIGMWDYEPMFSGISSLTSYVVIVRTNRQTIIHKYSLAKTTDIPNKVSELENDQGYATEEYVNTAISNIPSGDGSYRLQIATSDTLGGVQPVTKADDMTQSVGVDERGGLWTAPGSGINVNSAIPGQTIVVKEVDESGEPIEWAATDLPEGSNETVVIDFTVEEDVAEIYVPFDEYKDLYRNAKELLLYFDLRMPSADEATELGTIDAHIGIPGSVFLECGVFLRKDKIVPTNAIPNTTWARGTVHVHKFDNGFSTPWGIMGYDIKSVMPENKSATIKTSYNAVLPLQDDKSAQFRVKTSHPMGAGSCFRVAVRG